MRCISKKIKAAAFVALFGIIISGCGSTEGLDNVYSVFKSSAAYGLGADSAIIKGFSTNIAVPSSDTVDTGTVQSDLAESSLIVDVSSANVLSCRNIYEKLYPASTTKILTALVVIQNTSNLDENLTVSSKALELESGSSVAGLNTGDVISVRDALYGMMLASGNDAAVALAEHVGGSVEVFCDMMNSTAKSLGATGSNFVNPNGLHNENHYTTAYDLYLIFNEAIKNETFYQIVTTSEYSASYSDKNGDTVNKTWQSTCRYLSESEEAPEGVTVLGAKTGTTSLAGSCLVLLSSGKSDKKYISVILGATTRDDVYELMNQLLSLEERDVS